MRRLVFAGLPMMAQFRSRVRAAHGCAAGPPVVARAINWLQSERPMNGQTAAGET